MEDMKAIFGNEVIVHWTADGRGIGPTRELWKFWSRELSSENSSIKLDTGKDVK